MAQETTPEALLARVLRETEDSALRQVWADALLERGDPRGEAIALQVAAGGQPLNAAQDKRARSILSKHAVEWLGPLAGILMHKKGLVFDRGLLKACHVQVKSVPALEAAVGHPLWSAVERMWFCDRFAWDPRIVPLLVHPVMRSLRELIGVGMNTVFPRLAAHTSPLPHTTIQLVDDGFRGGDVEVLRAARSDYRDALPVLRRLGVATYDAAVEWVFRLPVVQRMQELSLTCETKVDAALLARAERLEALQAFELRPHFFVNQGEFRAHLVLRFTRDAAGKFSRVHLSVSGFRGSFAPRLDLPISNPRKLGSNSVDFEPELAGLKAAALTRIEVKLDQVPQALARFKRAEIIVLSP